MPVGCPPSLYSPPMLINPSRLQHQCSHHLSHPGHGLPDASNLPPNHHWSLSRLQLLRPKRKSFEVTTQPQQCSSTIETSHLLGSSAMDTVIPYTMFKPTPRVCLVFSLQPLHHSLTLSRPSTATPCNPPVSSFSPNPTASA